MSEKLSIHINWSQVLTSLFIGALLGAVTLLRFSDSQAVVVAGHTEAIKDLKTNSVSRREWDIMVDRLNRMESKIDLLIRE